MEQIIGNSVILVSIMAQRRSCQVLSPAALHSRIDSNMICFSTVFWTDSNSLQLLIVRNHIRLQTSFNGAHKLFVITRKSDREHVKHTQS